MKKVLSMFLIVSLLAVFICPAFAAGEKFGDFTWSFEKGVLTIDGPGLLPDSGPWNDYAKKVTTLVVGKDITNIMSLVSIDNVTSLIIHSAKLSGISIGLNNSTKIKEVRYTAKNPFIAGELFFASHPSTIIIEDTEADYEIDGSFLFNKDHTILYYYFDSKNVDVIIPEGVKEIRSSAFSHSNIRSVIFPSTLVTIDSYAFLSCKNLTSVSLPASVKRVGTKAFSNCAIKEFTFEGEFVEFKDKYYLDIFTGEPRKEPNNEGDDVWGPLNGLKIQEIVIPATSVIPSGFLAGCSELKRVVFSEGVERMDEPGAFDGCKKLESVFVPDSVTKLDYSFFESAPKSMKILCHEGSPVSEFAESYSLPYTIVKPVENVILSDSITLKKGKSEGVDYSVEPVDASVVSVEWISTDESIVVIKKGKLTGKSVGECDVICKVIGADGVETKAICHVVITQ